jgi:NAD(P)H-hydrate repair Nnr-like enzyme with NAD(P)H-hydrate dehydratase domain
MKGDRGIVGIFGGSLEYTGAPYFTGMGAMRSVCSVIIYFKRDLNYATFTVIHRQWYQSKLWDLI